MRVNVRWMNDNFKAFNKAYFNNEIPNNMVHFATDNAIRRAGVCSMCLLGGVVYSITISISNAYDKSERDYQNCIIT